MSPGEIIAILANIIGELWALNGTDSEAEARLLHRLIRAANDRLAHQRFGNA